MGITAFELIPVTILFDNPGITREEFSEILNTFDGPWRGMFFCGDMNIAEIKASRHQKPSFDSSYLQGIYGLARILNLPYRKEHISFLKGHKKIVNDVELFEPRFEIKTHSKELGIVNEYDILFNTDIELEPESKIEIRLHKLVSEGETIQDDYACDNLVKKIVSYTNKPMSEEEFLLNSEHDPWDGPHQYVLSTCKVGYCTKKYVTASLDELLRDHPEFSPDAMYNFDMDRGVFDLGLKYKKNFFWKKVGDKYYIDEKTFDNIPAGYSKNIPSFGYTDIILTSEAVRTGSWDVFTFRGGGNIPYKEINNMLSTHPESYEQYAKAVWDSHTSLFAKSKRFTHTELLRWRLLGKVQDILTDY